MEQEHEYTNEEAFKMLNNIKTSKIKIIRRWPILFYLGVLLFNIADIAVIFYFAFEFKNMEGNIAVGIFVIVLLFLFIFGLNYILFHDSIKIADMYYFKKPSSVLFIKSLYNLFGKKFMYYLNDNKNVLLRYKEWQFADYLSKSLNKSCLSGELKTVHKKDYDKIICRKPKKCNARLKNRKAVLYVKDNNAIKFSFGGGFFLGGYTYIFKKINEPISFTMPLQLKEKMIEEGYEVPEGLDITWVDTTKEKIRY